ncbi:hypothetical protein HD806DRAFT_65333 [Xylariaceae sp. AK1471]|nr:hypothetical protein HD806DRAFT_65333 [Xylariaceae sp. AK1471]
MPLRRQDAPSSIPDSETLETLLGRLSTESPGTKTLQQLSDEERQQKNLITFGRRQRVIQGDPEGIWFRWAGNVAHPLDPRMFDVMDNIYDQQNHTPERPANVDMRIVGDFLSHIRTICITKLQELKFSLADFTVIEDNTEQIVVSFHFQGLSFRVMQALDIDKDDQQTYFQAKRAKLAEERTRELVDDEDIPIAAQQYLMAQLIKDLSGSELAKKRNGFFSNLRASAQEKYWLQFSHEERMQTHQDALVTHPELQLALDLVRSNWKPAWTNGKRDIDHFKQYLRDETAAKNVWTFVEEDVCIVLDGHRNVVFASFEKLCQILLGDNIHDMLIRSLDMWSYYAPMPRPETRRHVVDNWIRKIHPELDPERATVDKLPAAKMAVAHYGCWARQGDPQGRSIVRTADSRFSRIIRSIESDWLTALFHEFSTVAFGHTSDLVRFLLQSLDPELLQEYVSIWEKAPDYAKLDLKGHGDNFLTLFAVGVNGYTQRHRDAHDVHGGMSGLFTLGRYTGKQLILTTYFRI